MRVRSNGQSYEDDPGRRHRNARHLPPGGGAKRPNPPIEFPQGYTRRHFSESNGELKAERPRKSMAVYRRSYKPYAGTLTPESSRFLVLFRYSRRSVFRSKVQTGLFVICFFFPLACLILIYLAHSASFLAKIGIPAQILSIDSKFFFRYMSVQGALAFLLTAFVGPGLVSPDLANGALPLFFCRPFSRTEYVLGKSSVLAVLLSEVTWIPGVVLFVMQASLAGESWTWNNLWIVGSLVVSSLLWIAVLSLLAMALSAWVKWRIVAGALLLGVMFFGAGFGQAVNAVLRTDSGNFFNVAFLMGTVCTSLFRLHSHEAISALQAWVALLAYCAICLGLLMRKVRAYEVIR